MSDRAYPRSRDREGTMQAMLSAVGRIIARDGFKAVGVNAVAREAGVDKVLIYRYFDGLDGLLRAFAKSGEFWPDIEELLAPEPGCAPANDAAGISKRILSRLARGLRRRPITQAVMRAELVEPNPLSEVLDEAREALGEKLVAPLQGQQGFDVAATSAVLAAGISYLVLRARTAPHYNGIPIGTDEGWRRINAAVAHVIDVLFQADEL